MMMSARPRLLFHIYVLIFRVRVFHSFFLIDLFYFAYTHNSFRQNLFPSDKERFDMDSCGVGGMEWSQP